MSKKNFFGTAFTIAGTIVLIFIGIIVAINFRQDSRIFQEPLLSVINDKKEAGGDADKEDGFKTLKYKKTAEPAPKKSPPQEKKQESTAAAGTEVSKIKVEVINYTGMKNLTEDISSTLKAGGFEVAARTENSGTPVATEIIDRDDGEAGLEIQKLLKAGKLVKMPDPKPTYKVTVKIGHDFVP